MYRDYRVPGVVQGYRDAGIVQCYSGIIPGYRSSTGV